MSELIQYFPQLMSGLLITLILTLVSLTIGLALAIAMTMGTYSDHRWLKYLINTIVFFIRGTPLLVQIFLIYFGVGQFTWVRETWLWVVLKEPMNCALIALSVNSACYTTVLFQGAIRSVPKNEKYAAEALAMSKWLAFRRIIFPRAFTLALPAYSNEVLMVLKGTSLASTITLLDLMGVTQQLIAATYKTVPFYIIAAVIYLLLNLIITSIFNFFINKNAIKYSP